MQRIAIMGSPGSGKSTLALRLGEATGLPVVNLDRLHWAPGWREMPAAERIASHDAAVAGERWIIEGNYAKNLGDRLKRADLVLLFVLPTPLTLFRITKRTLLLHGRTRPDMPAGCPERWDRDFMHWVWRWRRDRLPIIRRHIAEQARSAEIIELASARAANDLVARIAAPADASPAGARPA